MRLEILTRGGKDKTTQCLIDYVLQLLLEKYTDLFRGWEVIQIVQCLV